MATALGTAQLADALGVENAAVGLFVLAKMVGSPTALKDIGVRESDLDEAAAIATDSPVNNPEPVSCERVRALMENAFHGHPPCPIA